MPELPEVEVVRRGLQEHLVGRTFDALEVLHPRAVRGNDVNLAEVLTGLSITGTGRRGKFLWLDLSDGAALVVHLRMSGQMLVGAPGVVQSPHVRIRAQLGEIELSFVDQRTFGMWQYSPKHGAVPDAVMHIARDPFDPEFDPVSVARLMRTKNSALKTVLLNQNVVSGIGSIYADEAMWATNLRPWVKAKLLKQRDALAVLAAAHDVMERALAQGGTSFDSLYVNVNGASGYFSRSLNAYGQLDEPCARCGTQITKMTINGRSSYYCPHCQSL